MIIKSLKEVRRQFSRTIKLVAMDNAEVVLTDRGEPIAKIVPLTKRQRDSWRAKINGRVL